MNRYFFLTEKNKKYFEYMKSFVRKDNLNLFKQKETIFFHIFDSFSVDKNGRFIAYKAV